MIWNVEVYRVSFVTCDVSCLCSPEEEIIKTAAEGMIRIEYLWKSIFSEDKKEIGDRGRHTYGLDVKEVVIVFISMITLMWLKKNKISIINKILKSCNAEVCNAEVLPWLPVLLVRSTANFKGNKSWGNYEN